jgi:peptidoglycan/xylan/chitin deacetylase (PgdA/CDA1 family)
MPQIPLRSMLVSCSLFFLLSCDNPLTFYNPLLVPTISIAKYPDNKQAAVTFTFDDNCPSTFSKIVPLLDTHGFKATFFIISGTINSAEKWAAWRALSERGFEIGNHTISHPDLTKISSDELANEVNGSYKLITDNIGKAPVTFAQPGHRTNFKVDSIISQNHLFTRLKAKTFYYWQGWISSTTQKDPISHIDDAIKKQKWFTIAAHGVGDGWQPVNESFLANVLNYCKAKEKQIAVETFQNMAFYMRERESTKLTVSGKGDKTMITLKSDLPGEIYNYPLTLIIKSQSSSKFSIYNSTTNELIPFSSVTEKERLLRVYINNTYELRNNE